MSDFAPPLFSTEAEMSALGTMLLSPRAADEVRSLLEPEQFWSPAHRTIFAAMASLLDLGQEIDIVTLKAELISRGALSDVGGEGYLIQLAEFVPSPANSGHYARIVVEHWFRREVDRIGETARRGEASVADLKRLMTDAMAARDRARTPRSGMIGDFADGPDTKGVPSGMPMIDEGTTCGGWPVGQTSVIVAGTKGGKTALSVQVAIHAARLGMRVVYATFADLDARGLAKRALRVMCGWGSEPTAGTLDHEAWCEARRELGRLPVEVYDASEDREGRYVETFHAWLEGRQERPDLVVYDYAQKLRSRTIGRGSLLDHAEECSGLVKFRAAELRHAAVVGSQQTDGNTAEGRKPMTKGSRVWEEDAGLVVSPRILTDAERSKVEPEYLRGYQGLTLAELRFNRFGQSGGSRFWQFMGERVSFRELG